MIAGSAGLIAQAIVAVGVVLLASPTRSLPQRLAAGLAISIFGIALLTAASMLIGLPWQAIGPAVLAAAGAAASRASIRRRLATGWVDVRARLAGNPLAVILVAAVALVHTVIDVLKPAVDIDGLLYHGPVLASMVQTGSLWGWTMPNQYMAYTDLTMAGGVFLASATGEVVFDDAIQIPHLVLLMVLVVWMLERRFRSVAVRCGIALLVVSPTVVWLQPRLLYVDLAYAAAIVLTVAVLVMVRRPRPLDLLTIGVGIGAVIATKPAGALTGILLAIAALAVLVVRWRGSRSLLGTARAVSIWMLPPVIASGAFYIRNLVEFGNPVFPIAASFGPITLPGIVDLSTFASGARGNGLVDPSRLVSFASGIADGMLHGVVKPDYDPRSGGFGVIPLVVLGLVLLVVVVQVALVLAQRSRFSVTRTGWRRPAAFAGFALAVLVIQPSTFDSRYVIGPTVLLTIALLHITVASAGPRWLDALVGVLAVTAAIGQIAWTEWVAHPGARDVLELPALPSVWQPSAPGNPWGPSDALAWLPSPSTAGCLTIVVETVGGVTPTGLFEPSDLAELPYGLYGDALCNRVIPVQLDEDGPDAVTAGALAQADYLVLYADHASDWADGSEAVDACFTAVAAYEGTQANPEPLLILASSCR